MMLILCFSVYFLLICEHEEEAGLFCGTVMAMLRGQHISRVAFRLFGMGVIYPSYCEAVAFFFFLCPLSGSVH